MDKKYINRLLIDVLLFFSLFFAPWWISLVLGIIFLFVFEPFFELLLIGFFLDTLYGTGSVGILFGYPFTVLSALIFLASYGIKEHLVFNRA